MLISKLNAKAKHKFNCLIVHLFITLDKVTAVSTKILFDSVNAQDMGSHDFYIFLADFVFLLITNIPSFKQKKKRKEIWFFINVIANTGITLNPP